LAVTCVWGPHIASGRHSGRDAQAREDEAHKDEPDDQETNSQQRSPIKI